MIQRIQTLFLLLTIILGILFLTGNILVFSNNPDNSLVFNLAGLNRLSSGSQPDKLQSLLYLNILILLIPALSLISIFLYKNRKIQAMVTILIMVLILSLIIAIGLMIFRIKAEYNVRFEPGYKMAIPFLMLILTFLAYRGIKKDDALVKSYERMR